MGTEGAYPPYNFINDAGEIDGFERELGDVLCERAGLTCEWVTNDWDSIIPNLTSGNYDTIIAGMSITAERDEIDRLHPELHPPRGLRLRLGTVRGCGPRGRRDRGADQHDPGGLRRRDRARR